MDKQDPAADEEMSDQSVGLQHKRRRRSLQSNRRENSSVVCTICRSLLIQPSSDPREQSIFLKLTRARIYLSTAYASKSAGNGCFLCRMALAVKATLLQQTTQVDRLKSFEVALVYSNQTDRFALIEIEPLDENGRRLSANHPDLNNVDLKMESQEKRIVQEYIRC
ncbi:hypothetical protein EJ08DRAFT_69763 [Tothia fuscella]|uniref:Uncharacterized protein n=1 Tax=Tothia fuscella TaxID=1048955 RepID=A0A9P4NEK6_9PEZI|nr:hypothetical protein EJ08DRAFT_69763 [Tothia fuscella]